MKYDSSLLLFVKSSFVFLKIAVLTPDFQLYLRRQELRSPDP